jgi:hypothetical protein
MAKTEDIPQHDFTEEWISVGDLEHDPAIQRTKMDWNKVERIKKNFNPSALGVLTVSRRNRVSAIVLDGMHRKQAVSELTDGSGKVLCHVFTGLSRAEEAQMFLDLNAGNQPNILDKFKVRIIAGDEVAIAVNDLTHAYGWTVTPGSGHGIIQAVKALEEIYNRSIKFELEPNLLQQVLLVITRAWGNTQEGAQAVLMRGLAYFLFEHGDKIDLDSLSKRLETYEGGPVTLRANAKQLQASKRNRPPMAVAEILTEIYNKGRGKTQLPPWRRRS